MGSWYFYIQVCTLFSADWTGSLSLTCVGVGTQPMTDHMSDLTPAYHLSSPSQPISAQLSVRSTNGKEL